jgi:hypothetical protein
MSAFDFKDEHNPYAATTRIEPASPPPQQARHHIRGHYRSARGIATVTMIFLGVMVLALFVILFLNIELLGLLYEFQATGIQTPRMVEMYDDMILAVFVCLPIVLLAYILLYCWIYRVNKNVHAMGMKYLDYTPGWSVGWWFIPIANLWKPYSALAETWRASLPDHDRTTWTAARTPGILLAWWLIAWIGTILSRIGSKLEDNGEVVEDFITSVQFSVAGNIVTILALSFLIGCVHLLTQHQMAKHAQLINQPDPDEEAGDFSFLDSAT